MPVNRNALIRYNTIDNCLKNRYRQWTLDDLIEACSDTLYEFEGIDKGVSKRTVQLDIQTMRSEKLGYNAPIIVVDKKYYTYEDPNYSITNIPLTNQDLNKLTEVVDILRQFKGFTHFQELSGMVQRLENKIHSSKSNQRSVIDLEKNENLKGLQYIDTLYQALVDKICIKISYKSFKARAVNEFEFHPFLLKEYRNRWFILGKKTINGPYLLLALDRIHEVERIEKGVLYFDEEEVAQYFKDVVGVSVNEGDTPIEVTFMIDHANAPYVITKPIHHSQKIIEKVDEGIVFSIYVQLNFELERELLGFGDKIKVLSPKRLQTRIKQVLQNTVDGYHTSLDSSKIKHYPSIFKHKGYIINQTVYKSKEINQIKKGIQQYITAQKLDKLAPIPELIQSISSIKENILNHNLKKIIKKIDPQAVLQEATYYAKPQDTTTWHQLTDLDPTHFIIQVYLDDSNHRDGAFMLLPASHKKIFTPDEIDLMTSNSIPIYSDVQTGGIIIKRPLLLQKQNEYLNQSKFRTIVLRFKTSSEQS